MPMQSVQKVNAKQQPISAASRDIINLLGSENAKSSQQLQELIASSLAQRYVQDAIYTKISSASCIVINPGRPVSANNTSSSQFELAAICDNSIETTHIYELAASAYLHLMRSNENQMIVATGETGSGKSHALGLVHKHINYLSSISAGEDTPVPAVLGKSREFAVILESFGNAKTIFTNNSSRFSKCQELQFNEDGVLVGTRITTFHLEASRVCGNFNGNRGWEEERNFHIFYQLIAGANDEEKSELRLQDIKQFNYLNSGLNSTVNEVNDAENLKTTRIILKSLGFTSTKIAELLQLLAAILHIGNLEFEFDAVEKSLYVSNKDHLEFTAELLDVDASELEIAVTSRSIMAGDAGLAVLISVVTEMLDVEQAKATRNALASLLYSLVFTWIVEYTNHKLHDKESTSYIGLLDLSGNDGRRNLTNHFHQLCVNYMNEKVSSCTWQSILEGITDQTDPILFQTVETFADKTLTNTYEGLFSIVDKFSKNIGERDKITERLIHDEIKKTTKSSQFVSPGPPGWFSFIIKHDTEKTNYAISNFASSNRSNTWNSGIIGLFGLKNGISKSGSFIQKMLSEVETDIKYHPKSHGTVVSIQHGGFFPRRSDESSKASKKVYAASRSGSPRSPTAPTSPFESKILDPSTTLLAQFKNSVEVLTFKLIGSRQWNILCIRPNSNEIGVNLQSDKLAAQISSLKIATLAKSTASMQFSVTYNAEEFLSRYSSALGFEGNFSGSSDDMVKHVEMIIQRKELDTSCISCSEGTVMLSEDFWRKLEATIDKAMPHDKRKIYMVGRNKNRQSSQVPQANRSSELKRDGKSALELESGGADKQVTKDNEEPPPILDKKRKKTKEKKPKQKLSAQRYHWLNYTWLVTGCIPNFCLVHIGRMTSPDVQIAWREKVALCWMILMLSAVMIFFVVFLGLFYIISGQLLCPNQKIFSIEEIATHTNIQTQDVYVYINGFVYNIGAYIAFHARPGETIYHSIGKDASKWFPRITIDADGKHLPPSCGVEVSKREVFERAAESTNAPKAANSSSATASTTTPNYGCFDPKVYGNIPLNYTYCHNIAGLLSDIDVFHSSGLHIYRVGSVGYKNDALFSHNTKSDGWIRIADHFYDISDILSNQDKYAGIFSSSAIKAFNTYVGGDASLVLDTALKPYIKCLDDTFFIGVFDSRFGTGGGVGGYGCDVSVYITYGVTAALCLLMLVKFLAALQLGSKPSPEFQDKFVMLQVPCYSESEESLRKTIDSLSLFEYDDTRKLLVLIADGMVKGAGNDLTTPEIMLKILGVDPTVIEAEPKSYIAIGDGSKQHNKAKVYSGLYEIKSKTVPFIAIVKCGNESETNRAGNRGKRDSQMILMKFLNKVHFQSPMTPLDAELYHHIKDIIGVDPWLYEYCLMVDADTEAKPDSLNRLIAYCVQDSKIMGICGETQIANAKDSWVTAIQVYEYYISHHLAKAFESLFGSVTCLPGCFCMYRIRSAGEEKMPLLIHPEIISNYEENQVDTLHKKNLLSLGEDRYLTTLMLKYFPSYSNKFTPDAICLTIVPDKFAVLLSQRRRWINSTIHNLFELLFLPQLCGCLCFSMRMVVFLDLFATLIMPASVGYLGYLIYQSVRSQTAPTISLIMMAVAYGLQVIIFIIKAMPVFSFALPLYAYWNFDDFSWGNTRRLAGADKGGHGSNDGEKFDVSTIQMVPWSEANFDEDKKGSRKAFSPAGSVAPSLASTKSEGSVKSGATSNTAGSHQSRSTKSTTSRPLEYVPANFHLQQYAMPIPPGPYGYQEYPMTLPSYQNPCVSQPTMNVAALPNKSEFDLVGSTDSLLKPTEHISDDELFYQIRMIMASAPLEELTKKKVREALERFFGCKLGHKKDMINDYIEQVVKERNNLSP